MSLSALLCLNPISPLVEILITTAQGEQGI